MSEEIVFYPLEGESLEISDPSIVREVEFSEIPIGTHFYWGVSSGEEFVKTYEVDEGNSVRMITGNMCYFHYDEMVKVYDFLTTKTKE